MCGIAGVIGALDPAQARDVVERMTSSLVHRGPDDRGCHLWQSEAGLVAFGHTRLSILDLSASGRQPMTESTRRYWITFNGEIYNYQELRLLLDSSGKSFRNSTDTEVILRAFDRWAEGSFRRLRGMFAFALFDEQTRRAYLVRDPLGIKPVYYYWSGDRLLFASEVRALLSSGLVPRQIAPESIAHFLSSGWSGKEDASIANVRLLQPGEVLTIDLAKSPVQSSLSTYEPDFPGTRDLREADRGENSAHMLHLLRQSVKSHLVSDVPVGLFLSGGIDSTAILHLMKQGGCDAPKTFTVTFPDKEFSESRFASQVARKYGAEHQELYLSESSVLAQMTDALHAMDQPTMDGVNTFVIAKAVRSAGVKVALSGLGSDELFAGYPSFRRAHWAGAVRALPPSLRQTVAAAGRISRSSRLEKVWDLLSSDCTPLSAYRVSRRLFSHSEISQLTRSPLDLLEPAAAGELPGEDSVNQVSRLELRNYMTDLLLRDTDFMSMASSLEVRVPFVDKVVVSHALSMPGRWKLSGTRPKGLLLESLREAIPDYVWNRRKMGFVLPFDRWMRASLRAQVEETLSSKATAERAGLAPKAVENIWRRFLQGSVRWSKPWSLFVLMRWCEREGVSI